MKTLKIMDFATEHQKVEISKSKIVKFQIQNKSSCGIELETLDLQAWFYRSVERPSLGVTLPVSLGTLEHPGGFLGRRR
jgi:hypothetical protein